MNKNPKADEAEQVDLVFEMLLCNFLCMHSNEHSHFVTGHLHPKGFAHFKASQNKENDTKTKPRNTSDLTKLPEKSTNPRCETKSPAILKMARTTSTNLQPRYLGEGASADAFLV